MANQPSDKVTLQQWAAAGGDVPLSFKGREKSWANQVRKFAAGGEVFNTVPDMSDGGQIIDGPAFAGGGIAKLAKMLKGTQEVLPAAEREANLAKMLEGSAVQQRMYTGTSKDKDFSKLNVPRNGAWFTPSTDVASSYAKENDSKALKYDFDTRRFKEVNTADRVMPVYLRATNPYQISADDIKSMRSDNYKKAQSQFFDTLRAKGHDSAVFEDGTTVILGGPQQIKSAIGNRGTYDTTNPDMNKAKGGAVHMQAGGIVKLAKSLTGAKKAEDAAKTSLGEVSSMVAKMGEEGRSPIIPVPNRWFLQPDKFPHQQKLIERVLATTGKAREDFPSGAFIDPRTGEVLDSRIMNELGVVIDPKTNRPMMTAKGEAGIERIDPKLGAYTKSNLVRKGLFKPEGGDPLLNDLNFLATIEKGDVGHKYGLATEYASPAELFNTGTGANPTLRPRSRGDLFGVGDVVGQVRVGRSEPHDVYEKLFVAPKGSDVQGVKLSKAKGGEVKMQEGGAAFGVFPHMKRKRTKQDPEAAKNVPVDLARGFVAGALGMPGDIESLARLPYELITGNESPTILPTSGDIEKRLPFKSDTPVSRLATEAGQLGGGFYTGPGSGARAAMAVPKAIKRAGQDFVMAAPQGAPRMFIGPKAKTWDQAKANAALKMEREGRDPVDIWRETGTFRSADGVLRQEISDVGAIHRNPTQLKELGKQKKEEAAELQQRLTSIPGQKDMFPKALTEAKKPAREKVKTLKEEADELMRHSDVRGQRAKFALEHPELYKAYPELGEIPVYQGGRGLGSERASLRGGPQDMEMEITQSGLRADPRSSALHEMQHAIQTIEEMGPGGSPTFAFKDPKAYEILEELRKKALEPMSFEEYAKQYSHVPDLQQGYEGYKRAIPRVVKNMENDLQRQAAMEYYTRLAGEAEARATQAREPMSASQRAQEFPYSSYDVLPEDLIVKAPKSGGLSLQTVYHGSPHKFDKFDASKIGTGEGAQAYGHGLYFAESPGVASDYKRKLSDTLNVSGDATDLERRAAQMALTFGDNTSEGAINWLSKYEGKGAEHTSPALTPELIQSVKQKFSEGTFSPGGHLYTVDLPDEKIARMIDWDKPLSEQPEVIKALKGTDYEVGMSQKQAEKVADERLRQEAYDWADETGGDPVDFINNADWDKYVDQVRKESGSIDSSITGKDLHRMIMRDEGYRPDLFDTENYQVGTSEALRGYGIPGIRYLDATSRDAGKGTSNFVVFPGEEDALTILERKKEGGEVGMKEGGAAFGRYTTGKKYQGAVKRAKEADVNTLADPRTYAFVSGLLGEAPDQLGFSAMHPDYQGIQKAGEKGFTGGTILGVAPLMGPLTKNLPVGASIKPKGGNWMTGSVEKAVEPLKPRNDLLRQELQDNIKLGERFGDQGIVQNAKSELAKMDAVDQWIDRNLTNYIKKEMATPEDPVRKLAEQGIIHYPTEHVGANRYRAPQVRHKFGTEQLGQSEAARAWEDASDVAVSRIKIKDLADEFREPWMDKADPNTYVYQTPKSMYGSRYSTDDLGFDHIVDVLKQDLAAGRIRPEQLSKVSMEQAVRRTYDFDQDMAKKMREAQIKATEGMPVHKEYPEGYKWVELTAKYPEQIPEGFGNVQNFPKAIKAEKIDAPGTFIHGSDMNDLIRGIYKQFPETKGNPEKALEAALKYEGETMGHCVGGYCPDVLAGRSRIYSLRDAKGEPHVTVEVQPNTYAPRWEDAKKYLAAAEEEAKRLPSGYTDADVSEIATRMAKENAPPRIVQIKGKQNKAPKEEYLPFVQDFVRSGKWSEVGDLGNTGLMRADAVRAAGWDIGDINQPFLTKQEYDDLLLRQLKPEGMKAGGEVKMQSGGKVGALKGLVETVGKLIAPSAETVAKEASAAERAAAGRMVADVTKATQPMKMSEALGNLNVEGKGKLKVTQSDRTRVGGGNIGGAMFPGLSQVDPLYEGLVWGVGKKPTASSLINQSDDLTYWSTLLGAEDQLKTNPLVFNKLRKGFVDAMKQGKLSPELEEKINKNLALTFGEGAEIRDPKIWQKANTFDKRAALADVMLGQGIPPGKGGVALGGEKSGKGVIFKPTDILKRETEPLLLHPEHGGDVPTFGVGPRLFQFSGGMKVRPDLHPGFPILLEGQDMGMVFKPAPGEIAMRDFANRMLTERGRKPGYYEWTMGESGKGLPSQLITDEYLTYLQKAGYKKGGKVGGLSQAKNQRKK